MLRLAILIALWQPMLPLAFCRKVGPMVSMVMLPVCKATLLNPLIRVGKLLTLCRSGSKVKSEKSGKLLKRSGRKTRKTWRVIVASLLEAVARRLRGPKRPRKPRAKAGAVPAEDFGPVVQVHEVH